MGQIIREMQILSCKEHSLKETSICMEDYTIVQTLQSGNMILQQSDNSLYYLYHKQLQKTTQNIENLLVWLNHLYNHNYNVLKYQFKSRSLLCTSHLSIKILLEFGDISLNQILHQKTTLTQQSNPIVTQLLDSMKFDSPLQLLNFIKLMISVVEEQREKNKVWIRFHTKNLIFQSKAKCFKYFHLFQQQGASSQTFFSPELYDKQASEKETVFSMGMVLLSLFLKEDCSDCYNYQNHTFCEFIFEEKIERMKQKMITMGLLGILDDQSQYVSQFDEEVSEFILLMTNKQAERLSFAEVKRRYLWLIRKASFSFGVKNQVKSRSKAQPLTSKRVQRNKRHSKHRLGCFSTKEDVNFKNTFSEIDQSDFFSISKSNIQNKTHHKKGKENQVLRWKKMITNKMKEGKQNVTFNSQL